MAVRWGTCKKCGASTIGSDDCGCPEPPPTPSKKPDEPKRRKDDK